MASQVLSGVSCPDYRAVLVELQSEGWDIKRCNGGHLKLTHPDADEPVFGSMTPSDHLSKMNLRGHCNRAVRNVATINRIAREGFEKDDASFDETLRRKKASNKKVKSRSNRGLGEPSFETMTHMLAPVSTSVMAVTSRDVFDNPGYEVLETKGLASHPLNDGEDRSPPRRASKRKATKRKKKQQQLSKKNEDLKLKSEKVTENMIKSNKKAPPPKPVAVKPVAVKVVEPVPAPQVAVPDPVTKAAPKTARKAVEPKKIKLSAPQKRVSADLKAMPAGVEVLPAGVIELAMQIASGNLQSMKITQDMVGSTVLYDGRLIVAAAEAAVAPPQLAVVGRTAGATASGNGMDNVDRAVLALIDRYAPEFVTVSELGNILVEELSFKNANSAKTAISIRLKKLLKSGHVVQGKLDRLNAYRTA